jgi:hypothetical protein
MAMVLDRHPALQRQIDCIDWLVLAVDRFACREMDLLGKRSNPAKFFYGSVTKDIDRLKKMTFSIVVSFAESIKLNLLKNRCGRLAQGRIFRMQERGDIVPMLLQLSEFLSPRGLPL